MALEKYATKQYIWKKPASKSACKQLQILQR